MLFQTYGEKCKPAVLFFHAMGVTGASSEPVAKHLQSRCFCILLLDLSIPVTLPDA